MGLASSGSVTLWHLKVKLQWKLWFHWSQFLIGGQKTKAAALLHLWSVANMLLTSGDTEGHPVSSKKQSHSSWFSPSTLMQTNADVCHKGEHVLPCLAPDRHFYTSSEWKHIDLCPARAILPSWNNRFMPQTRFLGLKNLQESIKTSICLLQLFLQKLIT